METILNRDLRAKTSLIKKEVGLMSEDYILTSLILSNWQG